MLFVVLWVCPLNQKSYLTSSKMLTKLPYAFSWYIIFFKINWLDFLVKLAVSSTFRTLFCFYRGSSKRNTNCGLFFIKYSDCNGAQHIFSWKNLCHLFYMLALLKLSIRILSIKSENHLVSGLQHRLHKLVCAVFTSLYSVLIWRLLTWCQ